MYEVHLYVLCMYIQLCTTHYYPFKFIRHITEQMYHCFVSTVVEYLLNVYHIIFMIFVVVIIMMLLQFFCSKMLFSCDLRYYFYMILEKSFFFQIRRFCSQVRKRKKIIHFNNEVTSFLMPTTTCERFFFVYSTVKRHFKFNFFVYLECVVKYGVNILLCVIYISDQITERNFISFYNFNFYTAVIEAINLKFLIA